MTEVDLALGVLDHQLLDAEGRRCGKVDDLELEGVRDGKPAVAAILTGRGVLERLGFGAPGSAARLRARDVVPWSAVVRADRRGIVVRGGSEPR